MLPILRKRSKKLKESSGSPPIRPIPSPVKTPMVFSSNYVPLIHRKVRGLPISPPIPSPDPELRDLSSSSTSAGHLSPFQDVRDESSDATSGSSPPSRGLQLPKIGTTGQRSEHTSGDCADAESDEDECRPLPSPPYRKAKPKGPFTFPAISDSGSESFISCPSSNPATPPRCTAKSNSEKKGRQLFQDVTPTPHTPSQQSIAESSDDEGARSPLIKHSPKPDISSEGRNGFAILRWREDSRRDLSVQRLYVEVHGPRGKKLVPVMFPPELEHAYLDEPEHILSRNNSRKLVQICKPLQPSNRTPKLLPTVPHRDNDLELYRKEVDFLASVIESPSQVPIRPIGIVPPSQRRVLVGCRDLPDEVDWEVTQRNLIRINHRESPKEWYAGSVLGEGTFGRVYLAYNVPNRLQLAMKVVYIKRPIAKIVCQGLVNELKVLERLSRRDPDTLTPFVMEPSMATGLWSWKSSEGFLHIITNFCPGGDLYDYKGRVSHHTLMLVLAEVILGLRYLHKLGIVHHDLKPENVVIDEDGHCVITDYGGSKFLSDGTLVRKAKEDVVCTLPYAAPELISETTGKYKVYTKAVDYWALGATIFTLVSGEELLRGDNAEVRRKHSRLHATLGPAMKHWAFPEDLIDLTANLLVIDPSARLGNDDRDITKHPYFSDLEGCWDALRHRNMMPPFRFVRNVGGYARGFSPNCKSWFSHTSPAEGGSKVMLFESTLRKEGLELPLDESFDVLREHRNVVQY